MDRSITARYLVEQVQPPLLAIGAQTSDSPGAGGGTTTALMGRQGRERVQGLDQAVGTIRVEGMQRFLEHRPLADAAVGRDNRQPRAGDGLKRHGAERLDIRRQDQGVMGRQQLGNAPAFDPAERLKIG